ncbi:hypothetical protein FEZ63_20535 [Microvirga brassicacearum]|uniref:Uncharacterized protein n=1 Tax=Microvirga brassicacearum TaxID=2580413 RepID=A0A5N3P5K7_9HYPH|nr:hypothetical protein FEZ63_20535 [Microvirga brassicacearum]
MPTSSSSARWFRCSRFSVDAAIGHAMIWGNDPYWTYWVTDTLLMATVFGLGTALLGTGLARGALITAVHILLLTTITGRCRPSGSRRNPSGSISNTPG